MKRVSYTDIEITMSYEMCGVRRNDKKARSSNL